VRTEGLCNRVVVVGAGVSGCACAVTLAELGVAVTLVGSALDVVGLPGYGPDVWIADPDLWALVPRRLRDVWERGAHTPDDGTPLIVIDRRSVSLETKQLLEGLALVDLRQGLVVDVRPASDGPGIEVHTAFGDTVEGAACVLAVGLGLGGRVTEGERRLAGARYGEVAADAVYEALVARGIQFREVEREAGERSVGRRPASGLSGGPPAGSRAVVLRRAAALRPAAEPSRLAEPTSSEPGLPGEGLILPPGPREVDTAEVGVAEISTSARLGEPAPGIFPDGAVTGEWYRSPEYEGCPDSRGQTVRLAHRVSGQVIISLDADGLLEGHGFTWVVGQAAGAGSYLESLAGGARAARQVAGAILGARPAPLEGYAEPRPRDSPGFRPGDDRL
jgi:Pyridine nucleotide-disulphide oxidoreductase/Glucose inhibited division protein A